MPRFARHESIEPAERADSIDPMLANEPIEKAERAEPIEPTESTDPIDPIDSTELREPIHRIESSELIDQRDVPMAPSSHWTRDRCSVKSNDWPDHRSAHGKSLGSFYD